MTETAQRGGHIPGAANIPWAQAVNEDGTFKSGDALKQLYGAKGISGDREVIAYCRIGERSSHTWFVLKSTSWASRTCASATTVHGQRVGKLDWRANPRRSRLAAAAE